ncbi:hypothetical protein GWN42_31230 [candidate division KSB1 bacterium]|nr:hypothetical protein [Phycisphaerae bacterium]NIQ92532.1 hypothetical protein [Deltaproteobacteria bacterium]NIV97142.1 hypothetical protein [candidate division KSB1 bacterium]
MNIEKMSKEEILDIIERSFYVLQDAPLSRRLKLAFALVFKIEVKFTTGVESE